MQRPLCKDSFVVYRDRHDHARARPRPVHGPPGRTLAARARPSSARPPARPPARGWPRDRERPARAVGESSGVTSYHLRQLAAYGFVVDDDAARASSRRERWWRAAHRTTVLETLASDRPGDHDARGRVPARRSPRRTPTGCSASPTGCRRCARRWASSGREAADLSDWSRRGSPRRRPRSSTAASTPCSTRSRMTDLDDRVAGGHAARRRPAAGHADGHEAAAP